MLSKISDLEKFTLTTRDGEVGNCRDFLFDDEQWVVRYLEANTGKWLTGRRVLVSPVVIETVDEDSGALALRLSKRQLEDAPGIEHDQPVSRQYERNYLAYLGHGAYWMGGGIWGAGWIPAELATAAEGAEPRAGEQDEHLRSANEVSGYTIHAADDELGKVDDLLVRTDTWAIEYLVLDTRRWLPGRKVLLPVDRVTSISWANHQVTVAATREGIESAPKLKEPLDADAERAVVSHYDRLPVPEAVLINRPRLKEQSRLPLAS